ERHGGKVGVSDLRLLHTEHVGARVAQPLLHPREARLERVHVPGRDPHARPSLGRVRHLTGRDVAFARVVAAFLAGAFLAATFLAGAAFFAPAFLAGTAFLAGAAFLAA